MGAASGEMPRIIAKHGSPISELVEQIALANIALLIEKGVDKFYCHLKTNCISGHFNLTQLGNRPKTVSQYGIVHILHPSQSHDLCNLEVIVHCTMCKGQPCVIFPIVRNTQRLQSKDCEIFLS